MQCFVDPPIIYLYRGYVDFRKSINGLVAIVEQELNRSAFDSALYLFSNRAHDKVKILYWDTTGFALWYKRLEKHRFKWPKSDSGKLANQELQIDEQQLHWLLSGYDIIGHEKGSQSSRNI